MAKKINDNSEYNPTLDILEQAKNINQQTHDYIDWNQKTSNMLSDKSFEDKETIENDWADFGNSTHDKTSFNPTYKTGDLNEMRAADQGFWEKVGLGGAKMATTAATTFLDNTVGFIWGIGSAFKNGDASKIFDNDFTNAMADFNEWCEEQMPHYSSKYEGWGTDFWGNFIGKDLLQNAGFQIGTGLSLLVPGAAMKVPGNAFKATKMFSNFMKTGKAINTGNAAKDLVLSTYAAIGEAGIEGLNNKRDFVKYQQQVSNDEFNNKQAQLDIQWQQLVDTKYNGDEEAAKRTQDFNDYFYQKQDLQRQKSDREKFIQKEAEKVADMTFLANLALVGGTNFSTFGKSLTGYNLNKRFGNVVTDIVDSEGKVLSKNVRNKTAKDVIKSGKYQVKNENYGKWVRNKETGKLEQDTREYIEKEAKVQTRAKEKSVGFNIAKDIFGEGIEEMNQEVASQYSAGIAETEMLQYEALANNSMAYEDILKQMNDTWFSYGEMAKALGKVYTDPAQYRQFFGGAFGTFLSPHFTKKPGGGLQFHLNNLGAQSAAIREQNSTNAYIAEQINKNLNSEESKNYLTGLLRHTALERVKYDAVAADSRMDYENADFAQFVSDITMMSNAGKLDLLQARLEGMKNMSDEEMEKVCMQLASIKDKNGKSEVVGDFVDQNGNYLGNSESDKFKIRKKINERVERLQKDISLYQKAMNDIDGATGGKLDHETLAAFTWEKAQLMNKYGRAKSILGGSKAAKAIGIYKDAVSANLLKLNKKREVAETSLKAEKEKLSKQKTPDGKSVQPSELQKNLEKQIEDYTKQISRATQLSDLLVAMEQLQVLNFDYDEDKKAIESLFEKYKSFKETLPDIFDLFKVYNDDGTLADESKQIKDFSLEGLMGSGWWSTLMDKVSGTDAAESMTADFEDVAKLYHHAQLAEKSLDNLIQDPSQFTEQRAALEERITEFKNGDLIKEIESNIEKGIDAGDINLKNITEKADEIAKAVTEERRKGIMGKISSMMDVTSTPLEKLRQIAINNIFKKKKYSDLKNLRDFINGVYLRIAVNQNASDDAKKIATETFNKIINGKKRVDDILNTTTDLKEFDVNSLLVQESPERKQAKLDAYKNNPNGVGYNLNTYQFTEESVSNASIVQNEAKNLLDSVIKDTYDKLNNHKESINLNDKKQTNEPAEIKEQRDKLEKRKESVIKGVQKLIENFKGSTDILSNEELAELIDKASSIVEKQFNPEDFDESLRNDVLNIRNEYDTTVYNLVTDYAKQRVNDYYNKNLTGNDLETANAISNAFDTINKALSKIKKKLEKISGNEVFADEFESIANEDGSIELAHSVDGYYFKDNKVYRGHLVKCNYTYGNCFAFVEQINETEYHYNVVDEHGAIIAVIRTTELIEPTKRGGAITLDATKTILHTPNATSLQLFKNLPVLQQPATTTQQENRQHKEKREAVKEVLQENGTLTEDGKVDLKQNVVSSIIQSNVIMDDTLTGTKSEIKTVIDSSTPQSKEIKYFLLQDENGDMIRVMFPTNGNRVTFKDENGKTTTKKYSKALFKKEGYEGVIRETYGKDVEIVESSQEEWNPKAKVETKQEVQSEQKTQSVVTTTTPTEANNEQIEQQPSTTETQSQPTVVNRKTQQRKKTEAQRKRSINQLDEQIAELDSMLLRLQDAAKQNPQYHETVRTVTTFKQYVEFVRNNYKALGEPKNVVLDENQVFSMMDSFRQQLSKIFGNDVQFLSDEEIEQAAKDAQAPIDVDLTETYELSNEELEDVITNLPEIPFDTVSWNEKEQKKEYSSGKSQFIDYSGRIICVVDINGFKMPFYISTGKGGKKNVPTGKWYPIFGIASDGWLNKTTEKEILNYYNSPVLRQIAEALDKKYGDLRGQYDNAKVKATGAHIDYINQNLTPTENGKKDTRSKIDANIKTTKEALNKAVADLHKSKQSTNSDIQFQTIDTENTELNSIKEQAIANGTFMKAPNGKPTNLTEKQYALVRTKAFKDWFGDWENNPSEASKVVDENGEPLVVYHYTDNENLNEFSVDFDNYFAQTGGTKKAIFFTEDKVEKGEEDNFLTQRKARKSVFLNIKDLKTYNGTKEDLHEKGTSYREVVNKSAAENDVDGGVHMSGFDDNKKTNQDIWIIHNPNQVKSATDNVGTFSRENDDIRFSKSDGEIYGFTNEGKIVLNKDKFRLDTPVHEYTHLWDKACMKHSPELWKRGVELMKQTDEWQRVIEDDNYANIKDDEDLVASEVHSRLSGMLAAGKAISFAGNKRIKKGFWAKLIDWFKQFKDFTLRHVFGMSKEDAQKVTLEQFLSAPVADFMLGTDPRDVSNINYTIASKPKKQAKPVDTSLKVGDTVQYLGIAKKAIVKSITSKGITIETEDGRQYKDVTPRHLQFLYGQKPSANAKFEDLDDAVSPEEFIARKLVGVKINDTKNDITNLDKKLASKKGKTIDKLVLAIKDEIPFSISDDEIKDHIIDIARGRSINDIKQYAIDAHYAAQDAEYQAQVSAINEQIEQEPNTLSYGQTEGQSDDEDWDMSLLDSPYEDEAIRNVIDGMIADELSEETYQEYLEQRANEEGVLTDEQWFEIFGEEPQGNQIVKQIKAKTEELKGNVPPSALQIINDDTDSKLASDIDNAAKREKQGEPRDTWKPAISEFNINDKSTKFVDESNRDAYGYIYDLYDATGAFDYVKHGNLRANDKVYIAYGKVGENDKGKSFYNVVFLVDDNKGGYQMIGTLSSTANSDPVTAESFRREVDTLVKNRNNYKIAEIRTIKRTDSFGDANSKISFKLLLNDGNPVTTTISKVLNGSMVFSDKRHSLKDLKLSTGKTVGATIADNEEHNLAIAFYDGDLELQGTENFTVNSTQLEAMKAFKNKGSNVRGHIVLAIDKPDGRKQLIPLRVSTFGELLSKPNNQIVKNIKNVISRLYDVYASNQSLKDKNDEIFQKKIMLEQYLHDISQVGIEIFIKGKNAVKIECGNSDRTILSNEDGSRISKEQFENELLKQLSNFIININENTLSNNNILNFYINNDVFNTYLTETDFRNAHFTINPITSSGVKIEVKKEVPENKILNNSGIKSVIATIGKQGLYNIVVVEDLKGKYEIYQQIGSTFTKGDVVKSYSTVQQFAMVAYAKLKKGIEIPTYDIIQNGYIKNGDNFEGPVELLVHKTELGENYVYDTKSFKRIDYAITIDGNGKKYDIVNQKDYDETIGDVDYSIDSTEVQKTIDKGPKKQKGINKESNSLPELLSDKKFAEVLIALPQPKAITQFFNVVSDEILNDAIKDNDVFDNPSSGKLFSYLSNNIGTEQLRQMSKLREKYENNIFEVYCNFLKSNISNLQTPLEEALGSPALKNLIQNLKKQDTLTESFKKDDNSCKI